MHPIIEVQAQLVAALRGDAALAAIIAGAVFDAPPRSAAPPYVVIRRHDVVQRDGDLAPVQEHRLLLQCWADQPSRRRAVEMAERVVAVALLLPVAHAEHVRTETSIDETGLARASVTLRLLTG
ncbi:MAG TPA: DUF3168 domain-containing protein [Devosia sp.]|jgi:hypothetical protein|uniref:DUF3168 domain-containing protein n=1 Tax=Devosia sp. TaxID=1871048 RepID=UPI002F924930